ncbi:hypothetical protein [Adhaeribacter radiodurans]|uniref:hypothetical protein n=1 Tax=Adhaeribacter radiodurans TaxID=2745197 RepID=UPI00293C03EB|nr:hypothetical protein [Adhaeribacter radiodurans]
MVEIVELPTSFTGRRYELFWKYQLPVGKHTVKLKLLNPTTEHTCRLWDVISYSDKPTATVAGE